MVKNTLSRAMDFHSPEDYTAYHTRKQKEEIRKNLKKKIDTYNKKLKKKPSKTLADSLPISKPTEDLVYKGIIKVVYDRGFALQTKAVLVESTNTVAQVVQYTIEALNLPGGSDDYALEERDILAGTSRLLSLTEIPLQRKLSYGSQEAYMEFRLVELQTSAVGAIRGFQSMTVSMKRRSRSGSVNSLEDSTSLAPKEEVIDHGVSNIEITLEEGLQDIPPLVGEIQERLQTMVSTVAIDGVPKSELPPRRMLWDILKPQAAQLVKEIRRCVDSCEFLANRYCSSSVCKLIISLLLELITDHSKELVSVTKELCALRGAARTEFDISVDSFVQQTAYISKLIGMCSDSVRVVALTGHLLEVTTPNKFITIGTIQSETCFTGSKSISGVLIFSVVAAYLGLVRAGYEDKADYFASLAANVLKSAHKALDTVQKTEEYKLLHLHPLNSRVKDMEHKQKKAMDGLISSVRHATSSKASPDATPAMLLKGHAVLMATLDYLMVAQCASLLHKIVIVGQDLLQLPWVRGVLLSKRSGGSDNSSDAPKTLSLAPSLSSVATGSDNAEDETASNPSQRTNRPTRTQRKLLLLSPSKREQGDGAYDEDTTENSGQVPNVSFAQLGLRASRLQLTGDIGPTIPPAAVAYNDDGESFPSDGVNFSNEDTESDDEQESDDDEKEEHRSDYKEQKRHSVAGASVTESEQAKATDKKESKKQSQFSALDALEKLRHNYCINKEIAKVSESLLMTLTQKNNLLTMAVKDGTSERYTETALLIIGIAKQIREEVSVMESDLLVGQSMVEVLNRSQQHFSMTVRNVHTAALMATVSSHPNDGSAAKLLSNVVELQTISSETVGDALKALSEHKVALDQAEKIEQEFVSLMTGHQKYEEKLFNKTRQASIRKSSAPAKFMTLSGSEAEKVITQQRNPSFKMSMQQWSAKGSAKVTGGTVKQLMDKLVYHRTIDAEFVDVFTLTFHSFVTPIQLMKGLIDRYSITIPEDLSEEEKEAFKSGVLIPIRLRVIQAIRSWLNKSYDDFKDDQLITKLKSFINTIQKFMPTSAKELQHLLSENQMNGPEHLRHKPKAKPPPSIVPAFLTNGEKFDILDVNTLELARQMAITYSTLFRQLSAEELIGLTDDDSKKCGARIYSLSQTVTVWVTKEIVSEANLENRASVISYFIQTANSCFELKNFEALFAIMAGLQSAPVNRLTATWKRVSSQLSGTFKILCRVVSPDSNYQKYLREISTVGDGPCVPYIVLLIEDASNIMTDHTDFIPEENKVINYEKRRLFAQLIILVQCYQSVPYSLTAVQSLQDRLLTMEFCMTEQELLQLSWKSEMTP